MVRYRLQCQVVQALNEQAALSIVKKDAMQL